ncbi:MAG: hypothetical protein HRU15_16090, partial [Planctomycetes bacterium]|nr:hypothetical protein [Planctomycetota bacterium]
MYIKNHISISILITGLLFCASCTNTSHSRLSSSDLSLNNGNIIQQYTLSNESMSVSIIPALGGKIVSIKNKNGREFLSRSTRPYTMRRYGMKYSETEYDGIDECFPSFQASAYPLAPWHDRPIPDHGELCQLEWSINEASDQQINMSVEGKAFPFTFQRTAHLKDQTLILNYV